MGRKVPTFRNLADWKFMRSKLVIGLGMVENENGALFSVRELHVGMFDCPSKNFMGWRNFYVWQAKFHSAPSGTESYA